MAGPGRTVSWRQRGGTPLPELFVSLPNGQLGPQGFVGRRRGQVVCELERGERLLGRARCRPWGGCEQKWVSWVLPALQVEISTRGLQGDKVNPAGVFGNQGRLPCKIKWFRLNSLSTGGQLTFGIKGLTGA